jgi:pyrroline-5-carboxylate reductase
MLQTDFSNAPLLLIGCGNMGAALAEGWLGKGGLAAASLHIVEPSPNLRAEALRATLHGSIPSGLKPRTIVLAIKPQMIEAALPHIAPLMTDATMLISIAAGTSIAQLARGLEGKGHIVRAMPNTPAAIGAGISALFAPATVLDADRALAQKLLAAAGKTVWLDSEDQMAAVTALSGSGPGYVFYLLECLTRAGEAQGLPADLAQQLALETILGSAKLAVHTGEDPAALRRQVTSPNGTTAAGLDILMSENGLGKLIHHTVDAAAKRARELAG